MSGALVGACSDGYLPANTLPYFATSHTLQAPSLVGGSAGEVLTAVSYGQECGNLMCVTTPKEIIDATSLLVANHSYYVLQDWWVYTQQFACNAGWSSDYFGQIVFRFLSGQYAFYVSRAVACHPN